MTEVASFNILSPKTKAYRVLSAFISLKNDKTETGSVAHVIAANAKHSVLLNIVLNNPN